MATSNDSMTEGLAQIAQEEAAFGYGINRFVLLFLSLASLVGGLYLITQVDQSDGGPQTGSVFTIGSVFFALGAWRVNIIYKKLKALASKQDNE